MKVCPICNARCFNDMETCFGCMHQFTNSCLDDPFEEVDAVLPRPTQYDPGKGSRNIELRSAPRHAAPIEVKADFVQKKEAAAVVQAQYQLTISLEPMQHP